MANDKEEIFEEASVTYTFQEEIEKKKFLFNAKKLKIQPGQTKKFCAKLFCIFSNNKANSVVEWLERRVCKRHGLGSKPTRTILLCLWKRHLTAVPSV